MVSIFPIRETIIWCILIAATAATWHLAERALNIGPLGDTTLATLIAIAAIKIRMVIRHFMQVKTMPLPWKLAFDGWLTVVSVVIYVGLTLT